MKKVLGWTLTAMMVAGTASAALGQPATVDGDGSPGGQGGVQAAGEGSVTTKDGRKTEVKKESDGRAEVTRTAP